MIFARKIEFDWTTGCYKKQAIYCDIHTYETPFGLWIAHIDSNGYMISLKPYTPHLHDNEHFQHRPFHEIPSKVKPIGTPFQLSVWQALITIPHGSTSHYSAIAAIIDNPLAVRAAGTAIGRNPIIGFIPCHRILAKDGTIGGFAYGKQLKEELLAYEKNTGDA